MNSVTYTAALADDDAIKLSIATVVGVATYTAVNLDGLIGDDAMSPARTLTVVTSASVGAYVLASTMVVTGTDAAGRVLTETFTIGNADGGETLVGTKAFASVTGIVIQAQANTAGTFKFGVRDVVCAKAPYMVRASAAGNLHVGYSDGTQDTIPALNAKEYLEFAPTKIYGDVTTTVVGMTLFFK